MILKYWRELVIFILIFTNCLAFWLYKKERVTSDVLRNSPKIEKVVVYENRVIADIRRSSTVVEHIERYIPPEGKVTVSLGDTLTIPTYTLTEEAKQLIDKYNTLINQKYPGDLLIYQQPSTATIVIATDKLDNIIISTKTTEKTLILDIQDRGFTFRPGLAAIYNLKEQKFEPAIDFKFYYFNRYSAIVAIGPITTGIEVSRHIDDIISKFKNTELFVGYSFTNSSIYVGVRTNF